MCCFLRDTKSGFKSEYISSAIVIGMTAGRLVEEIMKFEKLEFVIDDFSEITIEKFNKLF